MGVPGLQSLRLAELQSTKLGDVDDGPKRPEGPCADRPMRYYRHRRDDACRGLVPPRAIVWLGTGRTAAVVGRGRGVCQHSSREYDVLIVDAHWPHDSGYAVWPAESDGVRALPDPARTSNSPPPDTVATAAERARLERASRGMVSSNRAVLRIAQATTVTFGGREQRLFSVNLWLEEGRDGAPECPFSAIFTGPAAGGNTLTMITREDGYALRVAGLVTLPGERQPLLWLVKSLCTASSTNESVERLEAGGRTAVLFELEDC